ncbi:MAG: acyltransferase family protein [Flavobacteriales bacterium]
MLSKKVFFPGLNALRFFAASAVVFTHVELMKKFLGHSSHWIDPAQRIKTTAFEAMQRREFSWVSPLIANAGSLAVVFFFVLSGFLITFLLLEEQQQTATISVRKFYMRRILRIWPLYFLVAALGFFVLPHFGVFDVPVQQPEFEEHFWVNLLLYVGMLPNLAFALFMAVPNIGQLWSIGVEEQFYLVWPVLVKKSKSPLRAIMIVFAVAVGLKAGVLLWSELSGWELKELKKFLAMLRIESMAIGGVGAYLWFTNKEKWMNLILRPVVEWAAWISIPMLIYFSPMLIQNGVHLIYSISFLIIIINVAKKGKFIISLETPIFDYLGKLSYGIYMYHLMIVVFSIHLLDAVFHFPSDLKLIHHVSIYALSFTLTIIVSALSYEFFEKRFVSAKKKYALVESGS